MLNLLYLFFLTLLPFGAKMAAEGAWSPAAALLCGCTSLASLCLMAIAASVTWSIELTPGLRRIRRTRRLLGALVVSSGLACTALSFVSAWFGYVYVFVSYGMVPFLGTPGELDQTLARETASRAAVS